MTIQITFYGASRRCDNKNSKFESFLQSVAENVKNASVVEVLVAIDPDDDIDFYQALEKRYAALSLRVIVSPVRYGYLNLHKYYQDLYQIAAKTTRILCGYSDDCHITMKHFDQKILEIDKEYKDNIYFIHTRNTHREKYLGDVSKNMRLLFWVQQAKEPASYYPYFSKGVLDSAQAYANKYDTKKEWCPIANSWIVDCYLDILSIYMKKFGVDRIYYLDNLAKINEDNTTVPHHRPYQEFGLSPNNIGFIKMLSNETQDYLEKLAIYLCSQIIVEMTPRYAWVRLKKKAPHYVNKLKKILPVWLKNTLKNLYQES
ncbi:MAG TPA: hypothetical protein VNC84_02480 [Gammaproteobacteria bacterium]|jgi:hypothetical protein|nr:hypothetical protein [Gammaproteobacteria bacterium]